MKPNENKSFDDLSMEEKINHFFNLFKAMTKEEVDLISSVLKWSQEEAAAFKFAKCIFESKNGSYYSEISNSSNSPEKQHH